MRQDSVMEGDVQDPSRLDLIEAADTFATLGGVVMLASSAQRQALIEALQPLVCRGELGPVLIFDPDVSPERRRDALVQATDRLLDL
jgi:hypothetical protein